MPNCNATRLTDKQYFPTEKSSDSSSTHFFDIRVMSCLFLQAVRNETGHYGTELFSEVAERIINTHNKSEPLYLYLAQQGVHSANGREPLQAPQRLLDVSPVMRFFFYFIITIFWLAVCLGISDNV